MKLSKRTIEILQNFSDINPGIVIEPGRDIQTMSIFNRGFAKAQIEETLPKKISIYALPEFLGVLSIFKEPDIEFDDKFLTITEGQNSIKYYYANESTIKTVPAGKSINIANIDMSFTLTKHMLSQLNKTSSIMKFDVIGISSKGVRAFISKIANSTTNVYHINTPVITESTDEAKIRIADLKIIPGDYTVEVDLRGLVRLTNVEQPELVYFIVLEK